MTKNKATTKKKSNKPKKQNKIFVLYRDYERWIGKSFDSMTAAETYITNQAKQGYLKDYLIAEKTGSVKVELKISAINKKVKK